MKKVIHVIGSGYSGLAAATILAEQGNDVTVFEKNSQIGGRARTLESKGYVFDMGPSWYWMPDVFENYFSLFQKKPQDYYELKLLDPSFTIFYGVNDRMNVPSSIEQLYELVEKEEKNGAEKLKKFLAEAEIKYRLAMREFIYLPSLSIIEYIKLPVIKNLPHLSLLTSYHKHVRKYFKNPRIVQLMEFPVLFLGGSTKNTPALFSLMNHAAFKLSTWYPVGGFSSITHAMKKIADERGVKIKAGEGVEKILVKGRQVQSVTTANKNYSCDGLIAAADYAHAEQLLEEPYRNYKKEYWTKKTFSPSCLIFYIGVSKKIQKLQHHNLFFDEALDEHMDEIYRSPGWPANPLFYVCCPSKTDDSVAPAGHENIFILMPIAPGLKDDETTREQYFEMLISRMEKITGEKFKDQIDYKKSYCISNFQDDYNAYKGNAYGLANTIRQTAFFRPSIRNHQLDNMMYCGQLTVPGPGVPPALISGEIAANEMMKVLSKQQ